MDELPGETLEKQIPRIWCAVAIGCARQIFGGNGLGVTKFEAGSPTHKPILVYPFHSLRPVDFQGGDGGAVQHSKNLSTTKIGTTSKRGGKHTRPPWRG